jgi:two-component system sensor histidine kinase/response regulator
MGQDKKYRILYVDDERNNLVVFKNAFFRYYEIFTAISGCDGLEILDKEEIHLVITDQKMPGMTGVEFLEKVVASHPNIIRIMLTAYSDIDFIMRAINRCGIYQYILKPWDNRQLKITIDNGLLKYQLTEDKKALIGSLEKANLSLERKVQKRTVELISKNEELVRTNHVKDKLFSILSHDLKMPMASLNVLLDLLINFKDQMNSDMLVDFSMKAKKYVHNVVSLMDNLLAWSLSQTGEFTVKTEPIPIAKIMLELKEVFQYISDQKQIHFQIEPPTPAPVLFGDENLTKLILRNLVSNAIKFTHEGGTIHLAYRSMGGSGYLEVSDSGIGMDQAVIELINGGQFPEASIGTRAEKGVGLGLKLCKEFAEMQNGSLCVESELGQGTKVALALPKN